MSDKKDLTTGNKNIVLHDNGLKAGTLIEDSIKTLTLEQTRELGKKAADEAIRLQAKKVELDIKYDAGRRSTEDHVDTWDRLSKEGKLTRQRIESEIETGAGKMRIESKSGATCFVATATYRDSFHPDVVFLRKFRDDILVSYKLGVKFINWYWIYGPKLAKLVENNILLRKTSRFILGFLVNLLRKIYK